MRSKPGHTLQRCWCYATWCLCYDSAWWQLNSSLHCAVKSVSLLLNLCCSLSKFRAVFSSRPIDLDSLKGNEIRRL